MHVWPFFVSDLHCFDGVCLVSSSESCAHIPSSSLFFGFGLVEADVVGGESSVKGFSSSLCS